MRRLYVRDEQSNRPPMCHDQYPRSIELLLELSPSCENAISKLKATLASPRLERLVS